LLLTFQDVAKAAQSVCSAEEDIGDGMAGERLLQKKTMAPEQLSALERGGDCQCQYYFTGNTKWCANSGRRRKEGKASKCHDERSPSGCQAVEKGGWGKCKWVPAPTPRPTPPTPEPTPEPTPAPTPEPTPKPLEPNLETAGCCTYKKNPEAKCDIEGGLRPLELRMNYNLKNNLTQCNVDVCNTWKWCKGYSTYYWRRSLDGPYDIFSLCDLVVDWDLWMQERDRDPDTFKKPDTYASDSLYEVTIQDPRSGEVFEFNARPATSKYSYGTGSLDHKPSRTGEWTCYQKE